MSHIFSYPSAASPTTLLMLHPALVTVQEEHLEPVQRVLEAADGTQWVFQLSGNRLQTYEVLVADLQEADLDGFAGYGSLVAFVDTIANWSMTTWDFTHSDGGTVRVRLVPGVVRCLGGAKGFFSGRFALRRIV